MVTDNERIYFEMAEKSRKPRINEKGEIVAGNCNVLSDLADIKERIDSEIVQSFINYCNEMTAILKECDNEQDCPITYKYSVKGHQLIV